MLDEHSHGKQILINLSDTFSSGLIISLPYSFDEPAMKATHSLTLISRNDTVNLGNVSRETTINPLHIDPI